MAVARHPMSRTAVRHQVCCRVLQKRQRQLRMHSRGPLTSWKGSAGENARNTWRNFFEHSSVDCLTIAVARLQGGAGASRPQNRAAHSRREKQTHLARHVYRQARHFLAGLAGPIRFYPHGRRALVGAIVLVLEKRHGITHSAHSCTKHGRADDVHRISNGRFGGVQSQGAM
jgi:hypothetical protein